MPDADVSAGVGHRAELVFDDGSADESLVATRRVRGVLLSSAALLAIVVFIVVQVASTPTVRDGTQTEPIGSVVTERALDDGWTALEPAAGEQRDGFPTPMLRTTDRICFGFARIDFGPDDLRPSLARCESQPAGVLAADEIRSVMSIRSGFDTWQVIEAAEPIESIEIRLASGERVEGDRIYVAGSVAALRLENDRDLSSMEWSTESATYRCTPGTEAWRTSVFCTDR